MEIKYFSKDVVEADKDGGDGAVKVMEKAMDYYANKIMESITPLPEPDLLFVIAAIREIEEVLSEDKEASRHADMLREMIGFNCIQTRIRYGTMDRTSEEVFNKKEGE